MKTVRTVCFVAAGFLGLQALQFLFLPAWFRYIGRMSGASELATLQQNLFSISIGFAPWLFAAGLVFLLIGWQYIRLWNFIPWVTILLMSLACWLIWQLAGRSQDIWSSLSVPPELYRILKMVQSFSTAVQVIFLMLPPVLILIFWFRAQHKSGEELRAARQADTRY